MTTVDEAPAAPDALSAPPAPRAARPVWRTVAIPSEHGGWGLTLEPALLGLLVAWSGAGVCLALAALVGFLARTPLKLAMVDASPPDAVVLDYAMPGMTGAEVAQRMRARHPHLPIVFCSGYADSLALDQIPDAVVLRKPVTIDDLSRTVRNSIG